MIEGIGLSLSSNNNTLTNNTANSNKVIGIHLDYSSDNILTNNTANSNWHYGIFIDSSSNNNNITNNTANNNYKGIYLYSSSNNNILTNNTANSNSYGIYLYFSLNNILTNNTANSNSYGINLYFSLNNTLTNNTASNNSYGINFGYGSNNNTMIANNMCYNLRYDVYNAGNSNSTTGDNNTCVTSYNYNDTNSNGCKYVCSIDSCNCSSCGECSYKLSHPSCSQVNLTANIINQSGNCINDPLNFNNKIFDCQGNIIGRNVGEEKKESYGIDLHGKQNNTIKNCIITGFYYGIYLSSSSSNILTNNTANLNRGDGISLYSSSNNILTNNTANNNHLGIDLYSSSNNNTLTNNTAKENNNFDINIGIWTNSDAHCNNLIENNTGSGDKPIKYFNHSVNLQNEILSELILCNADNSNISNVTITGSDTLKNNGLIIYFTENSNFTNINSSDNFEGIYLSYSSNTNTITNNTANNNSRGIYLSYSSNNTITNNTANSNSYRGISLYYSSNNILTNNTANSNNDAGICLLASDNNNLINNNVKLNGESGILLFSNSNFNNISNNKILDNNQGITISNCHPWEECSEEGNINNTIQGNEISNNSIGIYSVESNSTINSNIFCRNTNLDFNSSDWFSSSGDNNTCSSSKVNGWKDIGRTGTGYGCKNECAECKEPKDIFDAVEMLEYLSGDKENSTPCWDLNNDHTINLLDVLALIDNIGTE
ncbi:hypothetical protein MSIBF_A2470001 [groundwater metagenome]|uniref:Probable pectate lyase C n=1 Tax=groundwater metagenome TaxID=717931 RepID=A0A098EAL3_9ZZZZ